jgi:hypothetical protein
VKALLEQVLHHLSELFLGRAGRHIRSEVESLLGGPIWQVGNPFAAESECFSQNGRDRDPGVSDANGISGSRPAKDVAASRHWASRRFATRNSDGCNFKSEWCLRLRRSAKRQSDRSHLKLSEPVYHEDASWMFGPKIIVQHQIAQKRRVLSLIQPIQH